MNSPLLLDTHVWLWLCLGNNHLKKSPLLKKIEQAGHAHKLILSIISVWEVGMLISKNRLTLNQPAIDWIPSAIHESNILVKELSVEAAMKSSLLLDELHGDPSDRMIVATAIENHAVLVTQDRKIIEYAAKHNIPTLSV